MTNKYDINIYSTIIKYEMNTEDFRRDTCTKLWTQK